MKVAVTSTGDNMDSEMDPRFGRCSWFVVVDIDDMRYESVANSNAGLSSGAGIQAAGMMASLNVEQVITGNCGPKASQAFAASGIKVNTGYSGTVRQAVDTFKKSGGGFQTAGREGYPADTDPQRPMALGSGRSGGGRGRSGGGRGMGGCGRGAGMTGQGMNADSRIRGRSPKGSETPEMSKESPTLLKCQAEEL